MARQRGRRRKRAEEAAERERAAGDKAFEDSRKVSSWMWPQHPARLNSSLMNNYWIPPLSSPIRAKRRRAAAAAWKRKSLKLLFMRSGGFDEQSDVENRLGSAFVRARDSLQRDPMANKETVRDIAIANLSDLLASLFLPLSPASSLHPDYIDARRDVRKVAWSRARRLIINCSQSACCVLKPFLRRLELGRPMRRNTDGGPFPWRGNEAYVIVCTSDSTWSGARKIAKLFGNISPWLNY